MTAATRAFGADLPPAAGFRLRLLERDIERARRARDLLVESLRMTARELEALYGADHASVREAKRAITIAGLTS